jgi:trans-aconitate methyltransferase
MTNYVCDANFPHLGGNIDGGDYATYSSKVWEYLAKTNRTVLDVGCGQGHAMEFFVQQGCQVLGIEGLSNNAEKAKYPTINLDIQKSSLNIYGIDLVWCCEVVEHIEEQFLDNLLPLLTCGKCLAMTYAVPGQNGYHHVNCQEKEYWINKVKMQYDEDMTNMLKSLEANTHFGWHGLFFKR